MKTTHNKKLFMVLGYHKYLKSYVQDSINDNRFGKLILSKPKQNHYEFENATLQFASSNDKLRGVRNFEIIFISPLMSYHHDEAILISRMSKI